MRLKNSIGMLTLLVESNIKSIGIDKVKECYINCEYKQDKDIAFCYLVWFNIPQEKRQEIIALSIPREYWIGGYPDYTDNQLTTLLKKAIPLKLIKD